MSQLILRPISCDESWMDCCAIEKKAMLVDEDGNFYYRVINFSNDITVARGEITAADAVTLTIDGVTHTCYLIDHGLNKTTALSLSLTDNNGLQIGVLQYVAVDSNSFYIVIDDPDPIVGTWNWTVIG